MAFLLRLVGIGFGLPNSHHAYPYDPDEWTPLQAYRAMDPGRLDFNPHYFFNPTFHYYLVGAAIFAARLAGFVSTEGTEGFYFEHPEHLARMIGIGRLVSVLLSGLTVWLVYLVARRLRLARGAALLAALFLALHTSHVIHAHYFTVNAAVTFWSVVAFLGMERWIRKGGLSSVVWTGVAAGLAASTKYSGVLLGPLVLLAGYLRFRNLGRHPEPHAGGRYPAATPPARAARETALAALAAGLAFLAGSPYIVLAFREFLSGFHEIGRSVEGGAAPGRSFLKSAWHVLEVHLFASTPALVVASLAGAVLLLKRRKAFALLIVAWAAVFTLLSMGVGALSTDGRFLPLFPVVAVLAAVGLDRLIARRRRLGIATAAITVLLLAGNTAAILARFVGPMPQERASDWALAHLPDTATVNLSGSATYYAPDVPLRESLHQENPEGYARSTAWRFVPGLAYAEARPAAPDAVFLTLYLPFKPRSLEWLSDPAYSVAAAFPGKVRYLGRRVRVPLDLYDVDIWVLTRKGFEATK